MVEDDLAQHHSGPAVEAAPFLPEQDLRTQQTGDRAPLAGFEWGLARALHGEASLGSRRRSIAERLVAMPKGDEQLGVSPDGLGSRKKCRVKLFTPRVIQLVAGREYLQCPLQQALGIFDPVEVNGRIGPQGA
jgi:hypothetical protein